MKLVGDAFAKYKRLSPCIGISTWGVIHGRTALLDEDGEGGEDPRVGNPRGSVENPYEYDGKKAGEEAGAGTPLDRNHSHYLFVDNNSNGQFGGEISFRSELEDFISFKHDDSIDKLEVLSEKIRGQTKGSPRMVPVVTIAYGGGPGTLDTMVEAMESGNPIIVVKGSGRAVDLVIDWTELAKTLAAAKDDAKPGLLARQQSRGKEVLGDMLPKFEAKLNRLATNPQIYVFDFVREGEKLAQRETSGQGDSKQQNTLLPVLLKSIFESPSVNTKAKFPLAIKYNDRINVRKILERDGGLDMKSVDQELCADGRLLIFAAFHDFSHIVNELVDAGSDLAVLDHLIDLELRQDMQTHDLPKQLTEPPAEWLADNTKQNTQAKWDQLSAEERHTVTVADLRRVNWKRLPYVKGWTYRLVSQELGEGTTKCEEGAVFIQLGCRRSPRPGAKKSAAGLRCARSQSKLDADRRERGFVVDEPAAEEGKKVRLRVTRVKSAKSDARPRSAPGGARGQGGRSSAEPIGDLPEPQPERGRDRGRARPALGRAEEGRSAEALQSLLHRPVYLIRRIANEIYRADGERR
jgi:hypothetical protein